MSIRCALLDTFHLLFYECYHFRHTTNALFFAYASRHIRTQIPNNKTWSNWWLWHFNLNSIFQEQWLYSKSTITLCVQKSEILQFWCFKCLQTSYQLQRNCIHPCLQSESHRTVWLRLIGLSLDLNLRCFNLWPSFSSASMFHPYRIKATNYTHERSPPELPDDFRSLLHWPPCRLHQFRSVSEPLAPGCEITVH